MKIQCPSCDQRLEIPEELAGQTIECPACNASLAVPSLATPPPSPVQVQQSAPQVTASEKPKSSIPKWAIASVAGLAVLVVCLIMFFPNDPNGVSSSEPTAVKTDGESQQATTAAETKPIAPKTRCPVSSINSIVANIKIAMNFYREATGTCSQGESVLSNSDPNLQADATATFESGLKEDLGPENNQTLDKSEVLLTFTTGNLIYLLVGFLLGTIARTYMFPSVQIGELSKPSKLRRPEL